MVLAPCGFLRIADQIRPGDVVMMTDLGAAHPGEKFLGAVRVDATGQAVSRLVVDTLHREPRL